MKKFIFSGMSIVIMMLGNQAFSQKYKSIEDTAKLNKEYMEVTQKIADLTAELNEAQTKFADKQEKAADANAAAQDAAFESSSQASKATNGSVREAKRAKRKAKRALNEAEDAESANRQLKKNEKRISNLTDDLNKKQKRLIELDEMRSEILSQPLSQPQ